MGSQETELQKALREYLEKNPGKEREIADEFEAMVSSVTRWRMGVSHPRPILEKMVIEYLKRKSSEKTA